jgi:hypothetical protein
MSTANIDLGKIRFVWKGPYADTTSYVRDEVVFHQGRAWICIIDDEATTSSEPTETSTDWDLMVDGGDVASVLTRRGDMLIRGANGYDYIPHPTYGGSTLVTEFADKVTWAPAPGSIVQQVRQQYDGGQWHASTSYTPLPGSTIEFAPLRDDTIIHYRYNFYTGWWWSSHAIQHYRFYYDGTEQFRFTKAGQYDEGFACPEFWTPSWGTNARQFRIDTRAYTNNQHEQYHFSTHYFDGGSSSQNVTANWLTVTEYMPTGEELKLETGI